MNSKRSTTVPGVCADDSDSDRRTPPNHASMTLPASMKISFVRPNCSGVLKWPSARESDADMGIDRLRVCQRIRRLMKLVHTICGKLDHLKLASVRTPAMHAHVVAQSRIEFPLARAVLVKARFQFHLNRKVLVNQCS